MSCPNCSLTETRGEMLAKTGLTPLGRFMRYANRVPPFTDKSRRSKINSQTSSGFCWNRRTRHRAQMYRPAPQVSRSHEPLGRSIFRERCLARSASGRLKRDAVMRPLARSPTGKRWTPRLLWVGMSNSVSSQASRQEHEADDRSALEARLQRRPVRPHWTRVGRRNWRERPGLKWTL